MQLLQPGDPVPHFVVSTIEGGTLRYADLWQRRNLVLVKLPAGGPHGDYVSGLTAVAAEFRAHDTACVMTTDRIPGLPSAGVVVADRWGEIVHVATAPRAAGLPAARELLEWVEFLEHRCPECEGEAR
ncbi:hypothetical protein D3C83_21660 [compost metagenome]